jgi:hypothetical protein
MGFFIGSMIPIVVVSAFVGFGLSRGKKNYPVFGTAVCVIVFAIWGTIKGFYYTPEYYAVVIIAIVLMFLIILIDKKINPQSWDK